MQIVTVATQKGGAGKTMLVAHLAVAARMDGLTVAVVDTDPQHSLEDWWGSREADDIQFVMSSAGDLAGNITLLRDAGIDILIIDTPGAVTASVRDVVMLSDIVIIPTRPSVVDVKATIPTVDIVESCNKPMIFVINAAVKAAKATAQTVIGMSQFGTVAPVQIGARGEFSLCFNDGRTVMETSPGSKSDDEIRELFKYVVSQIKRRVKQ